jgi:LysR family transcriptional regulator, cys regulon transcriptional activator
MKLLQLRYIWEISKNNFNISATAEKLSTSQPGISKHVKLLEEELGLDIFERKGKQLVQATPAGAELIKYASSILSDVTSIKNFALDYQDTSQGSLVLATTHTQARYVLPSIIKNFISIYPDIKLSIRQGTPRQIAKMAANREVDLAIATEAMELFDNLVMLPCYRWIIKN